MGDGFFTGITNTKHDRDFFSRRVTPVSVHFALVCCVYVFMCGWKNNRVGLT